MLTTVRRMRRGVASVRDVWRLVTFVVLRFWRDNCLGSAASVTYTLLLALVPLMTITVGLLSAFPAFSTFQQSAQTWVFQNLVPQVGAAVLDYLEGFIHNAVQLTAVGVVGLVVSSVLLLSTIEDAFNGIWRVREQRPLLIRLLAFWAILTMTPLLFAASLSLTAQLLPHSIFDGDWALRRLLVGFLPLLFEFIGLAVLFRVIPNRPVRNLDALIGAGVAAVLFEASKALFALYLSTFPVYQTIYGALSIIPTFLVWLYVAAAIVLFGAVIAAALPDWRAGKLVHGGLHGLLPAHRVIIALAVLHELAAAGRLGVSIRRRTILNRVPVAAALIDDTLDELRHARFAERTTDDGWLMSRDPSTATLHDLTRALGIGFRGAPAQIREMETGWQARAAELMTRADHVQSEILGVTLAELFGVRPGEAVTALRRERRR